MMDNSVLFTSDLHIGHKLAARMRGFDSVDAHDLVVIDSLRRNCNKKTILWILGDVCMDMSKMDMLLEVPGRKKLIRGNHDKFNLGVYLKYFEDIHGFTKYKSMWLSHCPIHPQEMYGAKLNVHGHLHKNTSSPKLKLPYYNVNWDYHNRPISLEELRNVIENTV